MVPLERVSLLAFGLCKQGLPEDAYPGRRLVHSTSEMTCLLFFLKPIYFFRERERVRTWGGGRERGRENSKQTPSRAGSLARGLIP